MNISKAIQFIYSEADPLNDFIVRDDSDGNGPYIDKAAWKIDAPIPTEQELQEAWEAYQLAEANKPPEPPTEIEILGQQLVQRELESLQLQADNELLGQQLVAMDLRLSGGGL